MKQSLLLLLIISIFLSCTDQKVEEVTELKTNKEKASYTIGYDIGKNVSNRKMDIDTRTLYKGIEDGLISQNPLITEGEMATAMDMFEKERLKKVQLALNEQGEIYKVEGKKFLEANKNLEGIVTFKTGVQMKVLKEGTGKKPTLQNTVVFHFKAQFFDGTPFDNTYDMGEPVEFPMMQLLPGQQQVLVEMKEGGKAIAYIPPNMAFGANGGGELIPPHTTLIYELELLEVK